MEVRGYKYSPDTGNVYRNYRRFNREKVGVLRTKTDTGYLTTMISGKNIKLHRLAYEIVTGCKLPAGLVTDHINGNRIDNRWANLRFVIPARNQQNLPMHRKGKLVGSQCAPNGKYQATIKLNGKNTHIGMFSTDLEAHHAYLEAARAREGSKFTSGPVSKVE